MRQRFRFDPRCLVLYVGLLAAGCRGQPGPVVPVAAQPVTREQVAEWVGSTLPADPRLHRFRWLFRDEQSSAGGRGSARIAPPDSMRFDVAGPLGSGAASAAVVGSRSLWAEPPDAIEKLVPNYPLMWGMFGVARMPENGAALRGLADSATTVWQYVQGADTVAYARTAGSEPKLVTEVRQAGKVVGRAEATLGPDGMPLKSRLDVPSVPARLDLTFTANTRSEPFAADIWTPRQP